MAEFGFSMQGISDLNDKFMYEYLGKTLVVQTHKDNILCFKIRKKYETESLILVDKDMFMHMLKKILEGEKGQN